MNDMIIDNYGSNNHSCGMEAVTIKPEYSKEEILEAGLFLHPTLKPNSCETFALKGTQEQFDKFLISAKESKAAKQAFNEFGMPHYEDRETWDKIHARCKELEEAFVPWYDE